MLRLVAALVLLLGALSAMTTASAYKIARPTNGVVVNVSTYDTAQISVSPGSNASQFEWLQGAGSGAVSLDLTRGNGGATGYTLDTNASYTAYRVFKFTNNTNATQKISVNHGSGAVTVVSGYVGTATTPTSGTVFTVPSLQSVEINLKIAAGVTGGTFTYSVTVGP